MKRLVSALLVVGLIATMAPALAEDTGPTIPDSITVEEDQFTLTVSNGLVRRIWLKPAFETIAYDRPGWQGMYTGNAPDFTLTIGGIEFTSRDLFSVSGVTTTAVEGGARIDIHLDGTAFDATRTIEIYEGIAGMRTQTTLHLTAPLALGGYRTEQVKLAEAAPTIHAFRAGADWREYGWTGPKPDWPKPDDWPGPEEWPGPNTTIGDSHAGTWRDTRTASVGQDLSGPSQWISLKEEDGDSVFMVMERNDHPSSRTSYANSIASLVVDHSRDVLNGGPFEEQIHVENPTPGPGRVRVVGPGDFALEPSFVGFGMNEDDEAWQFFKYLTEHRLEPYDFDVTFNSNGTDSNQISTGAKDDLNFEAIQQIAPIARNLGVETFILDDGWQAISGDWCPDSPECLEPRYENDPIKFAPRFPDSNFTAVKEAIAPMKLGLWMNIMHFHPESETYQANREWACHPVGDGFVGYNTLDAEGSSNEAGTATWSPAAIPHVEAAVQTAIDEWDTKYFKFDFLVWLDCVDQGDMYDYRQAFITMLDRLISDPDNSDVTFEIDETNDYRLFPFESVTRGPSWFQNGSPQPPQLLHNIWNLSPFIPAFSLGQHSLGGNQYNNYPVDTLMAVALPGHITFFSDVRNFVDKTDVTGAPVIERTGEWMAYYKANRENFTQMIYPLLDDPIDDRWTALQSWNPEEGFGALLAFRQKDTAGSKTIALRNVPAGRSFDLFLGIEKSFAGTFTAEQLTNGIEISLPTDGAAVYLIEPH